MLRIISLKLHLQLKIQVQGEEDALNKHLNGLKTGMLKAKSDQMVTDLIRYM